MTLAPGTEDHASKRALATNALARALPDRAGSLAAKAMGGRLAVHLHAEGRADDARRDNRRVIARIDRWAARLTRHTDSSDLRC